MAEAALELMLADLRGRRSGSGRRFAERVLEHELIVRESSAPPGARWIGRSRAARPAKAADAR
jgi:LacI family transcriptional regulator